MKKVLSLAIALVLSWSFQIYGRKDIVKDFDPLCDSLSVFMKNRTTVTSKLQLQTVITRNKKLDFYFTESLGDLPWKKKDCDAFRKELIKWLPDTYKGYSIGEIYSKNTRLENLITPYLHNDGKPHESSFRVNAPKSLPPFIEEIGGLHYNKGLSGRLIALWQSHGRYFEAKKNRWQWQRARFFRTVEDMYTQSYVLPYLIPMLENAGAITMTPRERDTQINEIITDNDSAFAEPRTGFIRKSGIYSETGDWTDAGTGFADKYISYKRGQNPFCMGTARQIRCTDRKNNIAEARWTPNIPARGRYAVYISYKSLPKSTTAAHYTIRHLGGISEFIVNQRIGGGTWIYIGTFEFAEGTESYVSIDNKTPEGRKFVHGSIVTADAVKIGGGIGKIARGTEEEPDSIWTTSGIPSYMEGALYWMQWAGADSTMTSEFDNDYTKDFAGRGAWTSMMAGGSIVNPSEPGKRIPFDLSLAFHSDAGTSPGDSIIGTLAIYTSRCDGKKTFPNGENRMVSREYCDYVQSQIVNDIRYCFEPEWSRRQIWDRSYSESRTTSVPAMILELLSHQNFADMKYGHDPDFKFTVSRAVYKGILKFLSNRYGCTYSVQPLPVNSFSAIISKHNTVRLRWKETEDPLEKTAKPKGFILYRRIDDGGFDKGSIIKEHKFKNGFYELEIPIETGHIYSYKIEAYNDGGKSFPSEILCAGIPCNGVDRKVLIVNNFDRVSAPAWFDTSSYAGFDAALDGGVPYNKDISYTGNMYQYRRELVWENDENQGFGASFGDEEGKQVAGNTFDYPFIHGKAILSAGYPFCSTSSIAMQEDSTIFDAVWAMDIICGKQITTISGRGVKRIKYQVFPTPLQKAVNKFSTEGGNILISGANIGTDVWDHIFPIDVDSSYIADTKSFIGKNFGYKRLTNYAGRSGQVRTIKNKTINTSILDDFFDFHTKPNEDSYCVETPDGLIPSSDKSYTFLQYADTKISAGVCFNSGVHKSASLGFPIETIRRPEDIEKIIRTILLFFED